MTNFRVRLHSLASVAAILALAGCSNSPAPVETEVRYSLEPQPTMVQVGDAELPPDSPGPMAEGDFLVSMMDPQTVDDLKEFYPPEMFTDTEDGAYYTAFAFIGQTSEVFVTRNASILYSISGPDCGWCTDHWMLIVESTSSNIRITGGEYTWGDEFIGDRVDSGSVIFEMAATRAETVMWNPDGTVYERVPEEQVDIRMELAFRDGQWFVEGVAVE